MPSRQDQLHSHQFMVQRVVAALVMRETDPAQSPFRKIAGATLVSVLLAALSLGGAAAYGLVKPGGSGRWKTESAVIVEKESGALFVYRDKKLNPVLNYASALLLVGSASAKTVSVSRGSLGGVPRGSSYGIPGAPDSLPSRKRLSAAPWTVCSMRTGVDQAKSVLYLAGSAGSGGRELADGESAQAMVVATPDGVRYAIIGHYRHLIRDPEVILPGLVWTKPPLQVATALVNVLPAGADLVRLAPAIQGFGTAVSRPAGGKVGQVYVVSRSGGGEDYFVARSSGLAALTGLQKDLLLADPLTASKIGVTDATKLSLRDFTPLGQNVPPFAASEGPSALPVTTPALASVAAGAVCATVTGAQGASEVRTGVPMAEPGSAVATGVRGANGAVLADRVVIGPGRGVLVAAGSAAGAGSAAVSLVTDLGIRYPVPSTEVLGMLGYAGMSTLRLPAELVSLLPAGPALDPETARTPAP